MEVLRVLPLAAADFGPSVQTTAQRAAPPFFTFKVLLCVRLEVWFKKFIQPNHCKNCKENSNQPRRSARTCALTIVRAEEVTPHVGVGSCVGGVHPRIALITKVLTHQWLSLIQIFLAYKKTSNSPVKKTATIFFCHAVAKRVVTIQTM